MKTYITILRGINVGGKNIIKMQSLREMFEGMGLQKVRSFIQSGNVIFQHDDTSNAELEKLITEEILKRFTMKIPVIVIKLTEMKSIIKQNPFIKEHEDISKLYVTVLSKEPEKLLAESVKKISFPPDEYILKKRAIYLHLPNGAAKTKLTIDLFEKKLNVIATSRNLNTMNELVKIGDFISNEE